MARSTLIYTGMSITLEYHGIVAEVCGTGKEHLDTIESLGALKEVLFEKYPELRKFSFATAVNGIIKTGENQLTEDDLVSLLPPMSGG